MINNKIIFECIRIGKRKLSKMHHIEIIVFDLDLTLWPHHADELTVPISKYNNTVCDGKGQICKLYPNVVELLENLHEKFTLIVASRAKNICASFQLLHFLDIAKYFQYKEIYSGCKKKHFYNIHQITATDFSRMAFFDNDKRNIRDVKKLGVHAFLVEDPLKLNELVTTVLKL